VEIGIISGTATTGYMCVRGIWPPPPPLASRLASWPLPHKLPADENGPCCRAGRASLTTFD